MGENDKPDNLADPEAGKRDADRERGKNCPNGCGPLIKVPNNFIEYCPVCDFQRDYDVPGKRDADRERGTYTQGPWQADSDHLISQQLSEFHSVHIASVYGKNGEANARLIAAAPELLEALKELVRAGEHDGPCDNGDEEGEPFLDSGPCSLHLAAAEARKKRALEAIAKAEGR